MRGVDIGIEKSTLLALIGGKMSTVAVFTCGLFLGFGIGIIFATLLTAGRSE